MQRMRKSWACVLVGMTLFFLSACSSSDDNPPPVPPPAEVEVTTGTADNVTITGAILRGTVNPNGLDNVVAWFEWGFDNTLAGPKKTGEQPVSGGNTFEDVEDDITFQPPLTSLDNTVFFRIVAREADGPEVRGEIVPFNPSANPLSANAGSDQQNILMGTEVTLAGSASNGIGNITYEWVQVATGAPTVVIIDNTTATPSFTAPDVSPPGENLVFQLTVEDNRGEPAADNVTVGVVYGASDDFTDNTVGSYTWVSVDLDENPADGSDLSYDAAGRRLMATTGQDLGLVLSRDFPDPGTDKGEFSFSFTPIQTYLGGSGIWVRLIDGADPGNYYELAIFNWADPDAPGEPARFTKWVGDAVADEVLIDMNNYDNTATHTVTITFTPTSATAAGFVNDNNVTLSGVDNTAINVTMFEIRANRQDIYYDNIQFIAVP